MRCLCGSQDSQGPHISVHVSLPSWSLCRFRPIGTKAGKMLAPFILVRETPARELSPSFGNGLCICSPLSQGCGCPEQVPCPAHVHCQWIMKPGLESWGLAAGCPGGSSSLCPLGAPCSSATLPARIGKVWRVGHCQLVHQMRGCC